MTQTTSSFGAIRKDRAPSLEYLHDTIDSPRSKYKILNFFAMRDEKPFLIVGHLRAAFGTKRKTNGGARLWQTTWNQSLQGLKRTPHLSNGMTRRGTAGSKWGLSPLLPQYWGAWQPHGSTGRRSPDYGMLKMKFRRRKPELLRTRWEGISDSHSVWGSRSLSCIQFLFKNFAQDMPCQDVCLLNAWCVSGGHLK